VPIAGVVWICRSRRLLNWPKADMLVRIEWIGPDADLDPPEARAPLRQGKNGTKNLIENPSHRHTSMRSDAPALIGEGLVR
jgi:hypothetical protein